MEGHAVWGNNRNFNTKLGKHYLAMAKEENAWIGMNKSQDNSGCQAVTMKKKANTALERLEERTSCRDRELPLHEAMVSPFSAS